MRKEGGNRRGASLVGGSLYLSYPSGEDSVGSLNETQNMDLFWDGWGCG